MRKIDDPRKALIDYYGETVILKVERLASATIDIPLDRLEAICEAERDGTNNTQRIMLLQYASLRRNFRALIEAVLGKKYYNMGADVYMCDEISCSDIAQKCKRIKQFESLRGEQK